MNKLIIFALLVLASCASGDKNKSDSKNVTNDSFKREKALSAGQVPDFYVGSTKSLNPALQDETLDRLSKDELENVKADGDDLVEISVLCNRKDFDQAFKKANETFDRYQKIPQYWNLVANCHLNQGSNRKALLFYNKALELKPNYVPSLNNIGVMYSRQGEDQKALVAFERANKFSKFSKTPRYNLAKLYLTYGLADLAQPLFLGLLREAPQDVDLLNSVASTYFMMSDYNQAMGYYKKIPQSQWKKAEIGLNLALTLKKMGQKNEAEKVYKIVTKPSNSELRHYYEKIENQLGDAK